MITINTTTGAVTILGTTVNNLDAIVFDAAVVGPEIPTLSEWVLLTLALTLAGVGFAIFRNR